VGFHRLPILLGFVLGIGLAAPARAGSADVCAFRLATVSALFAAANEADAAIFALEEGDATPAADALFGAADRLLAEKKRVAAEWRPHLDVRAKKQLVKTLKAVRKRASKAARAAARRPDTASTLATAALDAIEAELAAQSDARVAIGCDAAGEIRVPELFVGAEKARSVPAGATIVAERGIRILGTLQANGPGGGLTLESRGGDVVIEGRLDGSGSPALPETAARAAAHARGARGGQDDGRPSCGHARSVAIRSSGHDIRIGALAIVASGSGSSCEAIVVSAWSQLHEHAQVPGNFGGMHGGHAGDILLDTSDAGSPVLGDIVYEPRPSFVSPPFLPGGGGLGQQLAVDPSLVPIGGFPVFRVAGGNGGDSGAVTVVYEGTQAQGWPDRLYDPIGGRAGHGGSVVWRATGGSALFPPGVDEVVVLGGNGGDGALEGGAGGSAFYTGDRVVNTTGERITRATAAGGAGGSIHPDTVGGGEDDLASVGGDGGDALVIGHHGWDGTTASTDGANGGSATAVGGYGGAVDDISEEEARGGNGGHVMGVGGRGGNGRPGSCVPEDTAAGGYGGDGGAIFLTAGDGGRATPSGTGGDGGSVLIATLGYPGLGGGGAPTGVFGGSPASFSTEAGSGGAGRVAGNGGAAVPVDLPPTGGTQHFTCAEVPPPRDPCSTPEWYTSITLEHVSSPTGDSSTTVREEAERICTAGSCRWIGHGSVEVSSGNGTQTDLYSSDERSLPTGPAGTSISTHCPEPGPAHQGSGSHMSSNPSTGTVVVMRHSSSGSHKCRMVSLRCCRSNHGHLVAVEPDSLECLDD
jgi:hypothetical protein